MRQLFFTLMLLIAVQASSRAAEQCSKSSPAYKVALLELYSSQGCSSCPPADEFVRQLYQSTGLNSDQVIALALHVDYWDYIGWKDPYAKAAHAERQRFLSAVAGSHTIYTPEFFLNGREYRPSHADVRQSVKSTNLQAALANIHIDLGRIDHYQLPLRIKANASQPALLFIALVESGLSNRVSAGENSGVLLRHDSVVRFWSAPVELAADSSISTNLKLSVPEVAVPKNLSVVAFVQNQQGQILQALSLPVCLPQ